MRWPPFLFIAVCGIAAWLWIDRSYAVATPAAGGPRQLAAAGCTPPQPSEDAAMVFAGFYEGPGVSTVRLRASRRQEDTTSVVDVEIAPGFAPVYLLLTSATPVVVRLSGWTRRLERVVLLADDDVPMGIVGAPAEIVTFASRRQCRMQAEFLYRPDQFQDRAQLSLIVRRPQPPDLSEEERRRRPRYRLPDAVGGAYEPRLLTVAAGQVRATSFAPHERTTATGDDPIGRIETEFSPAGVVAIDPAQLISNVGAERYRVLPEWAGLAQLLREGKIRRRGSSDVYEVLVPIELPANLSGAHRVTFEVRPGVAWPGGDPGHSVVRRGAGF